MAISIRALLRNNFKFVTSNIVKPNVNNATRTLYTPASLAIDVYIEARHHISNQFRPVAATFREKMKEFTKEDTKSLIFTEDLKAMLHIAEDNPDDIDLIKKMVKKFQTQNQELRFGNYVFGPVVMRTFYYLDKPNVALELFRDPELTGFFEQLTSYHILLTLLYNHQQYQEIRDAYDLINTTCTKGIKHPGFSLILVLAACLKQNTPQSLEHGLSLWKDIREKGFIPRRRAFSTLAYLALQQGKPGIALELSSSSPDFRHIEIRCIKLEAFAALERFDDIQSFLNRLLLPDSRENKSPIFFSDTIEKIEEKLNKTEENSYPEIKTLLNQIRSHNYVQEGSVLESLERPIDYVSRKNDKNAGNLHHQRSNFSERTRYRHPQRSRSGMKFL